MKKKYFQIKNDGLIVEEDLTLIGSSTKRGDNSKIGMFGSGWKYALAFLLRNNIEIFIYSGMRKIIIDCVNKKHRDMDVQIIRIDGVETSLTTGLGPNWTAWMAMREILSNAMDEPGYELSFDGDILPQDNTSVVYVENCDVLEDFDKNFDNYFSANRVPDYSTRYGKIFKKSTPSPMVVYRKGIRCYDPDDDMTSTFDIDCEHIVIDEDRLTSYSRIKATIQNILHIEIPSELFLMLLTGWKHHMSIYTGYDCVMSNFKVLIDQGVKFTTKIVSMFITIPNAVEIPSEIYAELIIKGWIEDPMKLLRPEGAPMNFVNVDVVNIDEQTFQQYFFNFNIVLNFVFGDFADSYELFRITKDTAYISAKWVERNENNLKNIVCEILAGCNKEVYMEQIKMMELVTD